MSLLQGARLGVYEITATIGAGGMGEVYRARDTRLHRDVALKILPEVFSSDPERLARFEREAQVLASLNHPRIAAIYGLEESVPVAGGAPPVRALVLELVEGDTLADRIAHGPIPFDEAVSIARQIAEALEAAHEQGIVHRDLKPANIKVTPEGAVKVLDFGLAKLADAPAAPSPPPQSLSPTVTSPALVTGAHVLLGTAAYMSPEQARGRPVDHRADIWAFGCVIYEMLAGKPAFADEDVSLTLSKVLQREPDFSALPASVPSHVVRVLRLCLQKSPRERMPHIGAVRLALDGAFLGEHGDGSPLDASASRLRRLWPPLAAAVIVALVAAAGIAWAVWPAPVAQPVRRFAYAVAADENFRGSGRPVLAISPDGRHFVYNTTRGLMLQSLDALEPRLLAGTEANNSTPFFSPDGNSVGYLEGNELKRTSVTGGASTTIANVAGVGQIYGITWAAGDVILFAHPTGIRRVSANGGTPELVIPAADGEQMYGPQLLPGGDAVLFTVTTATGTLRWDAATVAVQSLATHERKLLVRGGSDARYVRSGHLLYALGGTLFAAPFDVKRLEVLGAAAPVVQGLVRSGNPAVNTGSANYAVADDGTLVYVNGGSGTFIGLPATATPVWVDRTGHEQPLGAPARQYLYPRISPDGRRVAFDIRDQNQDIWVFDLQRKTLDRLTTDAQLDAVPVWTPDSERLVWASQRGGGNLNLYWQAADGTGAVERLTTSPNTHRPTGFTPDGTRLVFSEGSSAVRGQDLKILSLGADRTVTPLLNSPFDELNGEISPDGQWLAYQSDESGQFEVYVRPFPDTNRWRIRVSVNGGQQPAWARKGAELFYVTSNGEVMGASVRKLADGRIEASPPAKLVDGAGYYNSEGTPNRGRTYDVAADGRFLRIKLNPSDPRVADAAPRRIVAVLNWFDELKRAVPVK